MWKDPEAARVAVIGLGYVGLPLALAMSQRYDTLGYDRDPERIAELRAGRDRTREVAGEDLAAAGQLALTADLEELADRDVLIVSVPTPIDEAQRPDLTPLRDASRAVGGVLKPGDVVIFESTVYPGTTEEVCVPLLEAVSGLAYNRDFYCGYSPERISPGDKARRLAAITKVTAGSTPEVADFVDALYGSIIEAGTYKAASIAVAEAAKVLENTQRDVNIALINEFALICNRLGIDTRDVLAAAASKWNFLPFQPGLVGGHCIGVDPYYLTHKAAVAGYHPELILAARRVNNRMGEFVAGETIRLMVEKRIQVVESRALVMGATFKENCPDVRNSKVMDVIRALTAAHVRVDVLDPWLAPEDLPEDGGFQLIAEPEAGAYSALILGVAHDSFKALGADEIGAWLAEPAVVYDVKGILPRALVDARL